MNIRDVKPSDARAIAQIYNHYILETAVTFEEAVVDARDIEGRIAETRGEKLPWVVAEDDTGVVIGYAYASKWKGRCAYRYSVEVTVYLSPDHTGKGAGSALYTELFAQLAALGYHVVIGGITLPNAPSIALHEKFGMEKAGHFKEVGFKFGKWTDVGYWQGFLDENKGGM